MYRNVVKPVFTFCFGYCEVLFTSIRGGRVIKIRMSGYK